MPPFSNRFELFRKGPQKGIDTTKIFDLGLNKYYHDISQNFSASAAGCLKTSFL